MNPYWDPDVMKQRFGHGRDANTPNMLHDYVIYRTQEDILMEEYRRNELLVREWSIDVMQNGDDFYIIDMALAATSALSECVPPGLLKPLKENWLPVIPEAMN